MYKRRFVDPEINGSELQFNPNSDLRNVVLREPSVIDEFYINTITNPDGSESIQHVDPLFFVFNQQRLESIGISASQHVLDSLRPFNDSLAVLRKKCSDEDLMKMIKSKYLQSPAEILAWCRYMQSNIDQFKEEVAALVKANTSQVEDINTQSTIQNIE